MYKSYASIRGGGNCFLFGLTESDINRLQFNQEVIRIDFAQYGVPGYWGLILWQEKLLPMVAVDEDRLIEILDAYCQAFPEVQRDRVFTFILSPPIAERLRAGASFEVNFSITHPNDVQLFFWGLTEADAKRQVDSYFADLKPPN